MIYLVETGPLTMEAPLVSPNPVQYFLYLDNGHPDLN